MKKVFSVVLAAVMAVGMASVAFADVTSSQNLAVSLGDSSWNEVVVDTTEADKSHDESRPGDTIEFPMYRDDAAKTPLTKADVKKYKVDVRAKMESGSKAIEGVSIEYEKNNAYIELELVDPFVSVDDLDWEVTIYLTFDKSRDRDTEFTVSGTIDNDSQEADANDEYLFLGDSPVVEAEEYVKDIELDLDNGVSIIAKLFADKDYYGYGDNDVSAADDANMDKYPAIVGVYNQKTIGLANASNYVKFNDIDETETYYVYNGALEYLGTSKDKIPVATKYYVAEELLNVVGNTSDDIEDDDNDIIPDDTDDTDNVDMGGDDAPVNANDNPSTGR